VNNGGEERSKGSTWDDRYGPRSEEANRLLNLFELFIGFINDHQDVKRLPAAV
jgi:hypothetical protein